MRENFEIFLLLFIDTHLVITAVHVGVKIETHPYLQPCAQKKVIMY